eukprot:6305057-Alexandrium_andersonii.AAC.1
MARVPPRAAELPLPLHQEHAADTGPAASEFVQKGQRALVRSCGRAPSWPLPSSAPPHWRA